MHRNKKHCYSLTSSARPSSGKRDSQAERLATFRLTIGSSLVSCSSGISCRFPPFGSASASDSLDATG